MARLPGVLAALWWIATAWLATHKSGHPVHFGRYSTEFLTLLVVVIAVGFALVVVALRSRRGMTAGRRSWSRWIAASAFSLVAGLVATEGLIRAFDLFGASFYQEITRYILDLEPDPQLVYRHRAGLSATYQGVSVRINELGLRDRLLAAKSPRELRVLLLGDSVAFGWGVEADATIGRVAERELTRSLGRPVRTINSAVCGYNTVQELAFLQRDSPQLAPDLIVLVYVDNDVDPEPADFLAMRARWFNPPGAVPYLLKYSWLYRLYHYLLPHFAGTDPADRNSPGWRASFKALGTIADYGAQRDTPVAVFFFRLTPTPRGNRLAEDLAALSNSAGFYYEDMLPLFSGRNIRRLTNSLVDIHPNAAGHHLMGVAVAESIGQRWRPLVLSRRSAKAADTVELPK